jgi:2',3'-cyclic-nucleotide 2'-phosphodiesterase (5'-nucleotidase family)
MIFRANLFWSADLWYIESSCTKDNDGMFTGVAGEYRVKNVKIGGEPLDLNKTYTVATQNNVITTHGDGHTAFDGAKITAASEENDYQVVLKYVQDNLGGVIGEEYANPYGQERIIAVSTAE